MTRANWMAECPWPGSSVNVKLQVTPSGDSQAAAREVAPLTLPTATYPPCHGTMAPAKAEPSADPGRTDGALHCRPVQSPGAAEAPGSSDATEGAGRNSNCGDSDALVLRARHSTWPTAGTSKPTWPDRRPGARFRISMRSAGHAGVETSVWAPNAFHAKSTWDTSRRTSTSTVTSRKTSPSEAGVSPGTLASCCTPRTLTSSIGPWSSAITATWPGSRVPGVVEASGATDGNGWIAPADSRGWALAEGSAFDAVGAGAVAAGGEPAATGGRDTDVARSVAPTTLIAASAAARATHPRIAARER